MLITAVAPNWGLCVHCRPLGSGLNTAARGACDKRVSSLRPYQEALLPSACPLSPVPCEAPPTPSPCASPPPPRGTAPAGPSAGGAVPQINTCSLLLQMVPPQPSPHCPSHVELAPTHPKPRRFGVPPEHLSRTYRKCPLFLLSVVLIRISAVSSEQIPADIC